MPIRKVGNTVKVSCGRMSPADPTGLIGPTPCPLAATLVIVHTAQLATVADNSSGEESIALGAPAADAVLLGVRPQPMALDGACHLHAEEVLARYQRLGLGHLQVMTLADAGAAGVRVEDAS